MCDINSSIEAGFYINSQAVLCQQDYYSSTLQKKCLKTNALTVSACDHDTNPKDGKCYKCPRGYGNKENGICYKCAQNCLTCTGPNNNDCTSCDIDYGFTGAYCKRCDLLTETLFDINQNICVESIQHYHDMGGNESTVGDIQLYFISLDGQAINQIHVENLIQKYWVANLADNFIVLRNYNNLQRHNQVTIRIEFIIIDIQQFDYMYLSIDKNCQKIISLYPDFNGYDLIEINWENDLFGWNFRIALSFPHTNNSLELGIISIYSNTLTNYWVRDLIVDFTGCYQHCTTCSKNNSPIHCTGCEDGYFLQDNQYKACSNSCLTCINNSTNCLTLPNPNIIITCNINQFLDNNNICQSCLIQCTKCTSLINCQECQDGYYILNEQCLPCTSPCLTCINNDTTCLSCIANKFFRIQTNTCEDNCQTNEYKQNNLCIPCPQGCTTCDSTQCITCENLQLKKNSVCVENCGINYYQLDAQNCSLCKPECETCTDLNTYTSFKQNYYMNLVTQDCQSCLSPCQTCEDQENKCTSCLQNYYLYDNTCLLECPNVYFKNYNVFKRCLLECESCENQETNCINCSFGYVKQDKICKNLCDENYKDILGICCYQNCQQCQESQICQQCEDNYYLKNGFCYPCNQNCQTCENSSSNCLSCKQNYFFDQGKCLDQCPSGTYPNLENQTCLQCHEDCKDCFGPENTNCNSCQQQIVLWNNKCYICHEDNGPFDLFEQQCIDRCGDCKRFNQQDVQGLYNYNNCDDENLINGDGCNSDCQIEENFMCQGGNTETPDQCIEVIPPKAIIEKINDENQILLQNLMKK